MEFEFDAQRIVARIRAGGLDARGRRQLEQRRWETRTRSRARARIGCCSPPSGWRPSSTPSVAATGRMSITAANGRDTQGRRLGRRTEAVSPPEVPDGMVNVTDPDSQRSRPTHGYVQGYNAQAVVDEGQIVLAAEITNSTGRLLQLDPMVTAALGELERAGVTEPARGRARGRPVLERAAHGRGDRQQAHPGADPARPRRPRSARPGWTGGRYTWMRAVLAPARQELYRKRIQMIEPVFAHTKHNRAITRFHRRGRTAVRTEWRLLMATHNLTKLHRHQLAAVGA